MKELQFNSVETIANLNASVAFQVDSGKVFKDDVDICPVIIDKKLSYVSWGGDNNLPYHILDLIESDEGVFVPFLFFFTILMLLSRSILQYLCHA